MWSARSSAHRADDGNGVSGRGSVAAEDTAAQMTEMLFQNGGAMRRKTSRGSKPGKPRKKDPTLTHSSGVPPRATPDEPPSAAAMLMVLDIYNSEGYKRL